MGSVDEYHAVIEDKLVIVDEHIGSPSTLNSNIITETTPTSISDHTCVDRIRILTYNVGLLDYYVMGVRAFSNPPHSDKRLPFIPVAIRRENADIVCIQECYEDYHASILIKGLYDLYPYHARASSGGIMRLHNGLLILSRWQVTDVKLIRYEQVSLLESIAASKGFLLATIHIPGVGKVTIANIHTTAGGEADPLCPAVECLREAELQQSIYHLRQTELAGHHVILAGDFNCGPEASAGNYAYTLTQGYRDLYHEVYIDNMTSSIISDDAIHRYSWHPRNFLNLTGPHAHTPPQRIDHVMISSSDLIWKAWRAVEARIVFTEEIVPINFAARSCSTISDHYGVCVDIICNHKHVASSSSDIHVVGSN